MKKVLSIVLSIVIILSFTACSKTTTVDPGTAETLKFVGSGTLKPNFEKYYTVKGILEDVSKVDLSMEMGSVSGLTLKTETDEESSTSIDRYYRNDSLIYEVYNGYGENVWKYHTTSNSGIPIIVSYWDEGEDFKFVSIESNQKDAKSTYSISFNQVDKKCKYGAQTVDITVSDNTNTTTITLVDNVYYISYATYIADDGSLHRYTSTYDTDEKKITYNMDDVLISTAPIEVDETDEAILYNAVNSSGINCVAILLGTHEVYKDTDGNMFISAETTLLFEDEDDAEDALYALQLISVKCYDFTVEEDDGGEYYTINIGTNVFGVSDEYKMGKIELTTYALEEFDDYTYRAITLDDDLNITSIDYAPISYY